MKQALEKGPAQRSSLRNKYLPLIAAVGLLLFSFCSHAQYDSTKLRQIVNAYGFDWKNGKFRGSFIAPTDTPKLAVKDSAAIAYSHGKFWGNNGYGWSPLGNGADVPTWQQTLNVINGSILTQDNTINSQTHELVFKADNGATNTYLSLLPNTGTLNTVNGDDYADVSTNRAGGVPYITIGAGNLLDGDRGTLYIDQDVFRLSRADGLFHFKNNGTTYRGQLGFDALSANRNYTFPDASGTIALTSDLSNSWGLTGNAGTTDGVNFIGTTDNKPFNVKVNNQKAGRIESDDLVANTMFGYQAGNVMTGNSNTGIGQQALLSSSTGNRNTGIGYRAAFMTTTGTDNTAIGNTSLSGNISGTKNTGVGYLTTVLVNNLTNTVAVGANAAVGASNSMVLGSISGVNSATDDMKVGIGTTTPTEKLHLKNGYLRIENGDEGLGKVLTSDANGVGSWSDLNQIKNLITDYTDAGNVGVGEDNLISYAIPAGQLSTDGDYVEFTMNIIFASNANAKQVKLYYGATNFYASTSQNQNDGSMEIKGTIVRTGATSQRISFSQTNNTTLFPDYADYTTASETLVNAITLKATGEATSNNDIVQKILIVKYFPSN